MDSRRQHFEKDGIMVLSEWREESLYQQGERSGRKEDGPDFWGRIKKKD